MATTNPRIEISYYTIERHRERTETFEISELHYQTVDNWLVEGGWLEELDSGGVEVLYWSETEKEAI